MIFKIFSPNFSVKKLAFLTQNKANLCKMLIITLVFENNDNFFAEKLSKIAENCNHNINPRSNLPLIQILRDRSRRDAMHFRRWNATSGKVDGNAAAGHPANSSARAKARMPAGKPSAAADSGSHAGAYFINLHFLTNFNPTFVDIKFIPKLPKQLWTKLLDIKTQRRRKTL
jgi:hypothetical protein